MLKPCKILSTAPEKHADLVVANPSQRDVATEGGLSGMRTSGYGERLAQDTKQQVSYASNLTRGS